MATPSKRSRYSDNQMSIDGYIHNLSPMKTSRNGSQYFNATVQTQTGYEQLVSWKAEAHKSFQSMEQTRTPVHLENMQTIPSYTKPGSFDYKFGAMSQIVKPRVKLNFGPKLPERQDKQRTLEEVLTTSSIFEKVDIVAKVIQTSSPVPVSDKLTKLCLRIADSTGKMQMVIWNDHIDKIAINKSYVMKHITVRQFNKEKRLSSNPDSTFELCEELDNVVEDDEKLDTLVSIDSVQITSGKFCTFCNTQIAANEQLPTVRCSSCNHKFKTDTLTEQTTATITCDEKKYTVKKNLLTKFIPNLSNMTTDEIEDHLLLQMSAVISDRSVVKLISN